LRVDNVTDLGDDPVVTGGVVAGGALPAGSVLQVVSTTKSDTFTTTSTTFTDVTSLSATITPSSATSKILVIARLSWAGDATVSSARARLLRDATEIYVGDTAGSRIPAFAMVDLSLSSDLRDGVVNHLDSPSSTSALVYKIQIRTGAGTVYVNRTKTDTDNSNYARTASSITLMEVAG
jgi:hypothetical protein